MQVEIAERNELAKKDAAEKKLVKLGRMDTALQETNNKDRTLLEVVPAGSGVMLRMVGQ